MTALTRRTLIGAVATLLSTVFGVAAGATNTAASRTDPAQRTGAAEKETTAQRPRNGVYEGTIDRIVDGDHVVILLESGGETVGQYVIEPERVPDGEEGDSVIVWLVRGSVLAVWIE